MDGRRQRSALTAAENAVVALGASDAARARLNAAQAAAFDQLNVYAALPGAIEAAAAELETAGTVSASAWEAIAAALPAGPLRASVDVFRR
ncbi:MAG TPA: hypothetical protein VLG28_07690 [Acidimicrobiia bacterium]|nr:hypothetical protein [Acidimicrobiia bacterium]